MADPAPAPSGAGTPAAHVQPELRVVKDDASPEASSEVAVPPSKELQPLVGARAIFTPPDVLNTAPPSVKELWDRAREARHLPDSAGLRAAATVYVALVATPGVLAAVLYWALAHPARGAVLVLVAGCVTLLITLALSAL